jgi:hypothetical protein
MKIRRLLMLWCVLGLLTRLAAWDGSATAAGSLTGGGGQSLKEMPVLTGTVWQTMTADEKVAFVWGIGHVVTIEWQAAQMRPALKQDDLAAKLAEGLVGMSMNDIVEGIDRYYKGNPDDLEAPVMEVIWDEMVRPKIKTGIANPPPK